MVGQQLPYGREITTSYQLPCNEILTRELITFHFTDLNFSQVGFQFGQGLVTNAFYLGQLL